MRIVVLTGAGISDESSVATFRDADGLWEGHNVAEVAPREVFAADPDLVLLFHHELHASLATVQHYAAQRAFAYLESRLGDDLLFETQNFDELNVRGGFCNVIHMHGVLRSALCLDCYDR